MVARLPVPGSDDSAWGGILNEFLLVAHNADGTTNATKATFGLGNVSNTSDANKPISTFQQTALDNKVQLGGDIGGTITTPLSKARAVTYTVGPSGSTADYVCDGTDDQVEIQTAIDAATTAGGGTVHLRRGTYNITAAVKMKSNVNLEGEGFGTILIRAGNGTFGIIEILNNTQSHMVIQSMKVDDNFRTYSTNAWDPMYLIGATYILVKDMWLYDALYHALEFNDCTHAYAVNVVADTTQQAAFQVDRLNNNETCRDVVFERCVSINSVGIGFELHKTGFEDVIFRDCYVESCGGHGIAIERAGGYTAESKNIQILNCTLRNCGGKGIYLQGADECIVSGNRIENSATYGIHVDGVSRGDTNRIQTVTITDNHVKRGMDLTITAAGTGYSSATGVATTTGGAGTGLTVDTTVTSGAITAVKINTGGYGYVAGDIVTISGGGANATLTLGRPGDYGITLDYADHAVIRGNRVVGGYYANANKDSICLSVCSYSVVESNYLQGAPRNGVRVGNTGTTGTSVGNTVAFNTLVKTTGGVLGHYQDRTLVQGNFFKDMTGRVINFDTNETNAFQVIGNRIEHTGGDYGISGDAHNDVIVKDNRITVTTGTASKDGIAIFSGSRWVVKDNYISGMGRAGIQVFGTSPADNTIEGNTCTANLYGVYQSTSTATNTRIRNNNCFSNTTADYSLAAGTWTGTGNPSALIPRTTALTLTAADNGRIFSNEGATAQVIFTLPTAIAGYEYTFIVQDADGIRINAVGTGTIRVAGSVSAAAGNAQNSTVGSTITLRSINGTEWIATAVSGTWTVT